MELLSLKWNKHSSTFFNVLSSLREKGIHTDVHLGCEGQLFPVHQIVLTVCSDYFASIFTTYKSKDPVIILKDISKKNLKSLLDYMYIGEVNVKQSELASLITAAELLQIKGLAVEDDPDPLQQSKRPESPDYSFSNPSKRQRTKHIEDKSFEHLKSNSSISSQPMHSSVQPRDNSEKLVPVDEIKVENVESPDEREVQTKNEFVSEANDQESQELVDDTFSSNDFEGNEYNESYENSMTSENNSGLYDAATAQTSSQSDQAFEQMMKRKVDGSLQQRYYECSVCGRYLRDTSSAKAHMRIHTGDRPFHCSFCPYRANFVCNLRRHLKLKHGNL